MYGWGSRKNPAGEPIIGSCTTDEISRWFFGTPQLGQLRQPIAGVGQKSSTNRNLQPTRSRPSDGKRCDGWSELEHDVASIIGKLHFDPTLPVCCHGGVNVNCRQWNPSMLAVNRDE